MNAMLGGFIGGRLAFTSTAAGGRRGRQFHRYLAAGQTPEAYGVYPLLSKWGFIDLGYVTGG